MEQSSHGMPISRRSADSSTNHSSKSDAVLEDVSGIPHEPVRHFQDAESEKTEGLSQKKIVHCFKESSSLKNTRRWSAKEDEALTQLVSKHGMENWQTVACAIPGRNANSCLSRWKYILDPEINKGPWSQQEELRLIRAHQLYGNQWCKMVKHFPGRTNDALKGHWRSSMKSKLDSYLASGLLEQVPDLQEDLSFPHSSQLEIPKDSEIVPDRNRISSLSTPEFEQEPIELGENDDKSVGKSSDVIYAKAHDIHSAKNSKVTMAKSQQHAGARKKLASLSTPTELKSDVPHETTNHLQDMESEKTEGPLCEENVHSFKEGISLKNPKRTKGRWLPEEDEILTKMVTKHGLKNWQTIASAISGRDGQQCRSRWIHSLDPAINKEDWSEQEELKLIRAHKKYGNQWLKIVKHFPGRTNNGLKEHWRRRVKGKLNFYLTSGLLEQVPDLQEDLSAPESSQSDIPKDSQGSSNRNRPPSVLPTRTRSKRDLPELDENADTSEEENSDGMSSQGFNAHSVKVSEKIMAKSKQRASARRKLDFLSTPVELKVCTAAASCQRPPPRMQQTSPAAEYLSPLDACQDLPQNVPSERVDAVIQAAASNHPNDVHSPATPDPCSMEMHEANTADLMDMSYCDDLMIDSPGYPHGGGGSFM